MPQQLKNEALKIAELIGWKLLALAFNDFLKTSFPDRRLGLSQNN
jgi:hypothetical protein